MERSTLADVLEGDHHFEDRGSGLMARIRRSQRWQPSRRFAGSMALAWLTFAVLALAWSVTSTQGGAGFGAIALIALCLTANWAFEWKRVRGVPPGATVGADRPITRPPEEPSRSPVLSRRLLTLVLVSPRNAALYGLVVSLPAALLVTVVFMISRSLSGHSAAGLLTVTLGIVLGAGPAGGLMAYYSAPKQLRERFRHQP